MKLFKISFLTFLLLPWLSAFTFIKQNPAVKKTDLTLPCGKVKSYLETVYVIRPGNNQKNAVFKSKVLRNLNIMGKITEEIIYNSNDVAKHKVVFTKNSIGNSQEEKDVQNMLGAKSKLSKDKSGNKIQRTTFKSGDLITVKYNSKGLRVEEITTNSDGKTLLKILHSYDKNGNQIEVRSFFRYPSSRPQGDSLRLYISKFAYNDTGNMIKHQDYDGKGTIFFTKTYKYNSKGDKIGSEWYNAKSELIHQYKYVYDAVDKPGNWLKCIEYLDDEIKLITERKIEYY